MKIDVINFHFIDYCNYKCSYCFVKKENKMLGFEKIKWVVDNIERYFNSLSVKGRINLVGGEIFLCDYLQKIIDYIWMKKIKVSILTNGSLLTEKFVISNKNKIETIGISVDSLNKITNLKIGRCSGLTAMNKNELIDICKIIKRNGIKLKINHCISNINKQENISELLNLVKPDRFKILQMTIINGINNDSTVNQINENEFNDVISRYKMYDAIIETQDDLINSYVMIDSSGSLWIDKEKEILGNCLVDDIDEILSSADINIIAYSKRYN